MDGKSSEPTGEFKISAQERIRRDRVFKDAVASCAIEGIHFTAEEKKEIQKVYRRYASSDEMVAHFKRSMGIE